MQNRLQKKDKIKAFSLVEIMLTTALLSFAAILSLQIMDNLRTSTNQSEMNQKAFFLREVIKGLVYSEIAWENTYKDNSNTNMTCLKEGTDCSSKKSAWSDFRLRNDKNNLFLGSYDPLISSSGFTKNITPCSSFSSSGNDDCPIRIIFQWKPICPASGTCINPASAEVKIKFFYKRGTNSKLPILNISRFNVDLLRGRGKDTLATQSICEKLGGTYKAGETPPCSVNVTLNDSSPSTPAENSSNILKKRCESLNGTYIESTRQCRKCETNCHKGEACSTAQVKSGYRYKYYANGSESSSTQCKRAGTGGSPQHNRCNTGNRYCTFI